MSCHRIAGRAKATGSGRISLHIHACKTYGAVSAVGLRPVEARGQGGRWVEQPLDRTSGNRGKAWEQSCLARRVGASLLVSIPLKATCKLVGELGMSGEVVRTYEMEGQAPNVLRRRRRRSAHVMMRFPSFDFLEAQTSMAFAEFAASVWRRPRRALPTCGVQNRTR